jgi:hypothetical protein
MNFQEVEVFLCNIKSVLSSKIIRSNDEIKEIHVLTDSSRNPKQICRDIQSVLISKFGIDVDYKKISIAQVVDESFVGNGNRLIIQGINIENTLEYSKINVVLEQNGEIFEATVSGAKTERNLIRMASEATLKAVENAFGLKNQLILEDVENKRLANKEMVDCAISFISGGTEKLLCGNCFVDSSKVEASVKATLCAINRSIAKYKIQESS